MADLPVQLIDNTAQVIEEFNKNLSNGLKAVGLRAERHAKANAPVDTGRLRNSITFATPDYHSPGNTYKHPKGPQDADPEEYEAKGTPEANTVYIGTNVEYAEPVETRDITHKTGRAHFMRDAATAHNDEYKGIMEAALKAEGGIEVSGEMVE